jgi:hypothetical protein
VLSRGPRGLALAARLTHHRLAAVQLTPWYSGGMFTLRLFIEGFGFGNPPNYPHRYFLECKQIELWVAVPWGVWCGLPALLRTTPWSPFPSVCARRAAEHAAALRAGGAPAPPAPPVPLVTIDRFEINGLTINFEMVGGRFNINEFARILAEGEVRGALARAGLPHMPMVLHVHVVRARNVGGPAVRPSTLNPKVRRPGGGGGGVPG